MEAHRDKDTGGMAHDGGATPSSGSGAVDQTPLAQAIDALTKEYAAHTTEIAATANSVATSSSSSSSAGHVDLSASLLVESTDASSFFFAAFHTVRPLWWDDRTKWLASARRPTGGGAGQVPLHCVEDTSIEEFLARHMQAWIHTSATPTKPAAAAAAATTKSTGASSVTNERVRMVSKIRHLTLELHIRLFCLLPGLDEEDPSDAVALEKILAEIRDYLPLHAKMKHRLPPALDKADWINALALRYRPDFGLPWSVQRSVQLLAAECAHFLEGTQRNTAQEWLDMWQGWMEPRPTQGVPPPVQVGAEAATAPLSRRSTSGALSSRVASSVGAALGSTPLGIAAATAAGVTGRTPVPSLPGAHTPIHGRTTPNMLPVGHGQRLPPNGRALHNGFVYKTTAPQPSTSTGGAAGAAGAGDPLGRKRASPQKSRVCGSMLNRPVRMEVKAIIVKPSARTLAARAAIAAAANAATAAAAIAVPVKKSTAQQQQRTPKKASSGGNARKRVRTPSSASARKKQLASRVHTVAGDSTGTLAPPSTSPLLLLSPHRTRTPRRHPRASTASGNNLVAPGSSAAAFSTAGSPSQHLASSSALLSSPMTTVRHFTIQETPMKGSPSSSASPGPLTRSAAHAAAMRMAANGSEATAAAVGGGGATTAPPSSAAKRRHSPRRPTATEQHTTATDTTTAAGAAAVVHSSNPFCVPGGLRAGFSKKPQPRRALMFKSPSKAAAPLTTPAAAASTSGAGSLPSAPMTLFAAAGAMPTLDASRGPVAATARSRRQLIVAPTPIEVERAKAASPPGVVTMEVATTTTTTRALDTPGLPLPAHLEAPPAGPAASSTFGVARSGAIAVPTRKSRVARLDFTAATTTMATSMARLTTPRVALASPTPSTPATMMMAIHVLAPTPPAGMESPVATLLAAGTATVNPSSAQLVQAVSTRKKHQPPQPPRIVDTRAAVEEQANLAATASSSMEVDPPTAVVVPTRSNRRSTTATIAAAAAVAASVAGEPDSLSSPPPSSARSSRKRKSSSPAPPPSSATAAAVAAADSSTAARAKRRRCSPRSDPSAYAAAAEATAMGGPVREEVDQTMADEVGSPASAPPTSGTRSRKRKAAATVEEATVAVDALTASPASSAARPPSSSAKKRRTTELDRLKNDDDDDAGPTLPEEGEAKLSARKRAIRSARAGADEAPMVVADQPASLLASPAPASSRRTRPTTASSSSVDPNHSSSSSRRSSPLEAPVSSSRTRASTSSLPVVGASKSIHVGLKAAGRSPTGESRVVEVSNTTALGSRRVASKIAAPLGAPDDEPFAFSSSFMKRSIPSSNVRRRL